MKRFLAIVLALVMVLSLVACGGTSAQQPNDGQNAGVEADANVDAAAPAVTGCRRCQRRSASGSGAASASDLPRPAGWPRQQTD